MSSRRPLVPVFLSLIAPVIGLTTGARAATADQLTPLAATAAVGEERLTLDGRLDEAAWRRAEPVSDFVQREPNDGASPSFQTVFRVVYDAEALWIGVEARDPDPAEIVGLLTRRDARSPSDWVRVLIDSYRDRRSAFEFAVNPAGVRLDRYRYNDTSDDIGWDAVWDVAVGRDDRGWRAEFRIPFSQLRFRGTDPVFGFAVVRDIARLNEQSSWPHLPRSATGYVSSFGDLQGVRLHGGAARLEVSPYTVAEATFDSSADAARSRSGSGLAGLDVKYRVSPGVMMTATVNPDFGQVEADPAEVNLSAFETFFSERRPFFLEGSGTFRFDVDCNDGECSGLFYSRRIGRAPRGQPELGDGETADAPVQTTILGATKVTGRARGFSFGALNAITAEETASVFGGASRRRTVVEPNASYSVARVRREFANQSSLGVMLTHVGRQRAVAAPDLVDRAVTGGVDWDLRVARRYAVQGFWAGSRVSGTPEAIASLQKGNVHGYGRPDADTPRLDESRTALGGQAGFLALSKLGGERLRFNSNVGFKTPGFDINDVGFLRRADVRTMGNWVQLRHDRPTRLTRTIRLNLNQWAAWNYDGDRLDLGGNVNLHFRFVNNWGTGFGITRIAETFDDRLTRGGPGGRQNPATAFWQYLESDDRRRVQGAIDWFTRTDDFGSRVIQVNPRVTVRPSSSLELSLGARLSRTIEDAQWVENLTDTDAGRDQYVFGRLDQTTVSFTTRVNYAITPDLTVQSYMEPFASAGDYSSFRELVAGRADRYADRFAALDYQGQPDFTVRSLRATNVLRWEYRPGSVLFIVWQQARREREDVATSGTGGLGQVFGIPGRNVLLAKLSYWFDF
jgi:hypothetical protein